MATKCEACHALASEAALENWLDDKGLRVPHPVYEGAWTYNEALVDWNEVDEWAQAPIDGGTATDLGWHELHVEYAR